MKKFRYTLENSKGEIRETFRSPRVAKEMKKYYEEMYVETLKVGGVILDDKKTH